MNDDRRRPPRRLAGDDGAVVVEFALILPFLALMAFGIIDFGNAYRQQNLLEVTATTAARTATQTSKGRYADHEALRAVSSAVSGMNNTRLVKVITWKANSVTTPPCRSIDAVGTTAKGQSGLCNVYSPAQVDTANTNGFLTAGATCGSSSWDHNWCPLDRINADGQGDYFGVYVELEFTPFSQMVTARPITIAKSAIYRLEPPFSGGQ